MASKYKVQGLKAPKEYNNYYKTLISPIMSILTLNKQNAIIYITSLNDMTSQEIAQGSSTN